MSKEVSEIEIVIGTVNYYGPIILLAFGIVGCICNLITFTALQLRNNYCAFYFLASTLFDLLSIRVGVSIRFATDHFGSNLLHSDRVYCKLRAYLVSAIPLVSIQMKIAYRVTAIAIVISLFSLSHILYSYDLRPIYATMPGPDAMFDGMFVVIWLGIIPHGLMLLFGFTTVKNIRQVKRQTAVQSYTIQISVESCIQTQERKTNTQLILMMLGQVGLSSILILTRMISYAYDILKPRATGYEGLVDTFLMSFTVLLYYTNFAKSFYMYTFRSHLFRSIFMIEIKLCFPTMLWSCVCNYNRLTIY
ncbi:unnamed protein product [Rotaria magnacalcarata]|uniref:G-protein coupled receptors family 1 profile domain-containing protein n=1 Tax=Rotaria magnacalcarata TaxID=392030 RepID=A0A816FL27_9BILA|nr:unnamed protein product [Rotaria magnacalcarata]